MIFVTVGTHEQPFDRLLREADRLAASGAQGPVFCQTGYSRYTPSATAFSPMLSFPEMQERLRSSSVVVSHGGPGTIAPVLAAARPLVLVPRQRRFGEHVDDHQVAFCRRLGRDRGIPVVEDIADLQSAITRARQSAQEAGAAGAAAAAAIEDLRTRIAALVGRPA